MRRAGRRTALLACALTAAWFALAPVPGASQELLTLTHGLVIDRPVRIRPGVYRLPAPEDLNRPVVTIRGSNLTVDLSGVVLEGAPRDADPDEFSGVAILVDGGDGITITGATIRGHKVGILARGSTRLRITRSDLSYNWKQRLYSGIEKESLLDWMSYHQNEKDEWLRFGAGIYLDRCDGARIDHNTILQGQNGLMVTASKGLTIWNNTFQFLSSIGLGLYRVSDSTIMHNRIDWCVRGYSHGFYNRGQDSAGLLMYEQSSRNVVAYNSVTHGGDGLFLWAGQSTMDTGKGGANDNLFYGNDFSHAPTNGIEATFSRNRFIANRVEDNWHGVWGGYSYESLWLNNRFARNAEAIAIEHGQHNRISGNSFEDDAVGIRLWQNATQDPNWGYPKNRDTRSQGYLVEDNRFLRSRTALDVRDTANLRLVRNRFHDVIDPLKLTGATPGLEHRPGAASDRVIHDVEAPGRLPGGMDPMLEPGDRRGREFIIVDEWGPYDWKSPKLWPALDAAERALPFRRRAKAAGLFDGPVTLKVLGPEGAWTLVSARGASVSATRGKVGDVITVTPDRGRAVDYEITLSYVGGEVTSPRGVVTPAGQPYLFNYRRFFVPIPWTLRFYAYPEAADPVKQPRAFARVLQGEPVAPPIRTDRIDYLSGGAIEEGVPADRFALVAEGTASLPPGDYTLQVISDDGVRVWVDGRLVLDAWEPHESRVDAVDLRGGRRRLKVEYYDAGGWAELRFDILPRRVTK